MAPPINDAAALQSCIPLYSYFSFVASHVPLHLTLATIFSPAPASTPIIAATFSATAAPPTGQPFTGASPLAIAAAKPPQPGNPQPPQLAPGKTSSTSASLGSTSTANFLEAKSRIIPKIKPSIPSTTTA